MSQQPVSQPNHQKQKRPPVSVKQNTVCDLTVDSIGVFGYDRYGRPMIHPASHHDTSTPEEAN